MREKDVKKDKLEYDKNSDTIKIDKDEINKNIHNNKRKVFTNNEAFPWFTIILILIYVAFYGLSIYGKENMIDVDLNGLNFIKVYTGEEILKGNFIGILTNIFVHRSLWDLINTIFILLFCGFFIERYIKRKVIFIIYSVSVILFSVVSMFIYPTEYYVGSFTIVAFLIGMCIYFCYRFRRFVLKIDMYIYIALTFIGFFISYMVDFYNIFQFIISYLIGVFVMFILDTKALRENK